MTIVYDELSQLENRIKDKIAQTKHNHFYKDISLIGRLNVKVAPLSSPVLFSAHILPPCASMILLEINNPTPVPPGEVVTNFENIFGIISGRIPEPVSLTLTIAWLSFFCALIVMLPPSLVNLAALLTRFDFASYNKGIDI
jgi:hypothetical protein